MTIIERILEIAEEKNIKQVEIANLLDKGTAQITSWKKRGCNPPAEYLPQIAKLLNVSISFLMTGEEENNTFTYDEMELIDNYRKLNTNDKSEIHDIIQIKINREENKIINSKIG